MPDVAKALTDQVLRRVRDVHGIAHSRELARTLLSHSQRLLNSLLGIVTTSTTFTTYPHQQFLPNIVERVSFEGNNAYELALRIDVLKTYESS